MTPPSWSDHLEVVTEVPPNAGTPLADQRGPLLGADRVYVRSNFPVPAIDLSEWRLTMAMGDTVELSFDDIAAFPQETIDMTLECAGNGRTLMRPTPSGTPWTLGGASPTSFTGPRLRDVLAGHRIPGDAAELVFTGADSGLVPHDGEVPYAFSLSIAEALEGDALLAHSMLGEPLSAEHGAPVRLVVPGHYAMKSVKWLDTIAMSAEPFAGHFVRKYRYYADTSEPEGAPIGPTLVRSLIASPADAQTMPGSMVEISGNAWSDITGIQSVEVSAGEGTTWASATLTTTATGATHLSDGPRRCRCPRGRSSSWREPPTVLDGCSRWNPAGTGMAMPTTWCIR